LFRFIIFSFSYFQKNTKKFNLHYYHCLLSFIPFKKRKKNQKDYDLDFYVFLIFKNTKNIFIDLNISFSRI